MFGLYNGIFQIKYLSEIKNDEAAGAEKAVVEEVVDELPEESPEVESDEDIKADASLVKAIDTYRKIKEIDKELTEKEQATLDEKCEEIRSRPIVENDKVHEVVELVSDNKTVSYTHLTLPTNREV